MDRMGNFREIVLNSKGGQSAAFAFLLDLANGLEDHLAPEK